MSTVPLSKRKKAGEPAWDIAQLYPSQGYWSEDEYLRLDTNRLVEYSHGFIEVLPMPTMSHQAIMLALYRALLAFVEPRGLGEILVAPMPVRVRGEVYREPDVLFMLAKNAERMTERFWRGADLVMEILSPGAENRERDLKEKRRDYSRARIREYWIADPEEKRILVLRLGKRGYVVHGDHGRGEQTKSALLPGFEVDVSAVFKAR